MLDSIRAARREPGFGGPPPFCEKKAVHVGRVAENAGALHRFGSFRTGFHLARFFQGGQRLGFKIEFGLVAFLFPSHLDLRQANKIASSGENFCPVPDRKLKWYGKKGRAPVRRLPLKRSEARRGRE
jgi:hypothetical protein